MANATIDEQVNFIKEDARKVYDDIVRKLTNRAREDLTKASEYIIKDFYYSYLKDTHEPKVYERTHNLYNMINPQTIEKVGYSNGLEASVVNTAITMQDVYTQNDKYHIYPSVVFDLMWMQGHRGLPDQVLNPEWKPTCVINNKTITQDTPHDIMIEIISNWDKLIGQKHLKEIEKRIKKK